MEALSPEQVARVARIARLSLTPEERERLAAEASGILGHFAAVLAAGAGGEAEGKAGLAPRADEPAPAEPAVVEAIVAQFPRREGRLAKVPGGL